MNEINQNLQKKYLTNEEIAELLDDGELDDLLKGDRKEILKQKKYLTNEEIAELLSDEELDNLPGQGDINDSNKIEDTESNGNNGTLLSPESLETLESGLTGFSRGMIPFYDEAKNSIISGVTSPFINNTDNDKAGYGDKFRANYDLLKARDKELAEKHPYVSTTSEIAGSLLSPSNKYIAKIGGNQNTALGKIMKGTAIGGTQGLIGGLDRRNIKDWKQNIVDDTLIGGAIGAGTSGTLELGKKVVGGVGGLKNLSKRGVTTLKKGLEDVPVVRKFLTKSADEIKDDVAKFAGRENSEGAIGEIFRNIVEDAENNLNEKSHRLFSKARDEIGDTKFQLKDPKTNFMGAIKRLSKEQNKTGKRYLNNIVDDIDNVMNYEQVRTLQEKLSKDLINGKSELNSFKVAKLADALDKDIMNTLSGNKSGYRSLDLARSYYKNEQNNANSLTNALKNFIKNKPDDSQLGRRVDAAVKNVSGKQTSLKKILDQADGDKVNDLKKAIQANITTRSQYNRMSPEQKRIIYKGLEKQAEKLYNGGILNQAEKSLHKAIDNISSIAGNVKNKEQLAQILSDPIIRMTLINRMDTEKPFKE